MIHIDSGAFGDLDAVDGFAAPVESCGPRTTGRDGNELGFFDQDQAGGGAVGSGGESSRRGELKTHFAAETKGGSANLKVAGGFEN